MKHCLAALVMLALPVVARGAEKDVDDPGSLLVAALILFVLPATILLIFFVTVVRKSGAMKQGQYLARAAEHIERVEAHTDRLERKLDRMTEVLESIERELKRNPGSKPGPPGGS